jgi:PhnB protein
VTGDGGAPIIRELFRLADPSGRVGHAELAFGTTTVMVCDEHPELGILAPPASGGGSALLGHELEKLDSEEIRRRYEEAGST